MCCNYSYISPPSILSWITVLVAVAQAVDVQLVDSGYHGQGRVEVNIDGQWGTICDMDWDLDDAIVVCRQLGFASHVQAVGGAAFGEGKGPIHYSSVQCSGEELDIGSCKYSLNKEHGCTHSDDAGVICYPGGYSGPVPVSTNKPSRTPKIGQTNWSDIIVSIVFPAAILFAIYLVYRRLYAGETPPSTPNRNIRAGQQRNIHRTEQYRVVPVPNGTLPADPCVPTDPDAPPPYEQVISEFYKETVPVVTVSRDDMDPSIVFTPTTPSDDDTIPISADEDVRVSRV